MLRISLAAIAIFFHSIIGIASSLQDTTSYKNRRLKLEEINFVSSYYHQEGNNSAVTGGIGTEKLSDFATTIDVRLSKIDNRNRKHTLVGEIGVDVYSSASSDKIDPNTISSASMIDQRVYPSLTYSISNDEKRSTITMNGSISTEYDYFSKGASLGWSKLSKDKNREFAAKALVFLDTWSVILPIELRNNTKKNNTEPRNSYSASFTLSQVINKRMQLLLLSDLAYQEGLLGTLYHRTYFSDGSHKIENLPKTRLKLPLGIRWHYFVADRYIIRAYYRYYQDSWGLKANTYEIETPIKLTPFVSISPFYRYYSQQGIDYFAPYQQHDVSEKYYSSDYDLSTLQSHMMGMGLRLSPPGGIWNMPHINSLEFRYGHYQRSTKLNSNIISLLIKLK
jgi:hypothetical protein